MSTFSSIIRSIEMIAPVRQTVDFISQSASLTIQITKATHGRLVKHVLSFKITPINVENDIVISKICRTQIFSVCDSHNYISTIGKVDIPAKVSVDKDTQGVAGGFRGYTVTVEWNSI